MITRRSPFRSLVPRRRNVFFAALRAATAAGAFALFAASGASAATITVTTTADAPTTPPTGSLRWAIQQANLSSTTGGPCQLPCVITFDAGAEGTHALAAAMDAINVNGVTIDGYSAPNAVPNSNPFGSPLNAAPKVVVRGPGGTSGLSSSGSGTVIRGLVLQNFTNAISLGAYASDAVIAGNFIGTDVTGGIPAANETGIALSSFMSGTVTIGGSSPADFNVISGNSGNGIVVSSSATVFVQGNYIGVNAAGNAALGNGVDGIRLQGGASGNKIGDSALGNVISGNGEFGIEIEGNSGAVIDSNRIGTNAAGTGAIPNGAGGIVNRSFSHDTLIGYGGSGNLIVGGGSGVGIDIIDSNYVRAAKNTIRSNAIGVGVTFAEIAIGNEILDNAMSANGIGIDLGNDGVTANDAGDPDFGPNNFQNFPTIDSAVAIDGLPGEVKVSIDSSASGNAELLIEIFKADDSANAQGLQSIATLCTNNSTLSGYAISIPSGLLAPGDRVVATATGYFDVCGVLGSSDGTSEFSPAVTAVAGVGSADLSVTKTDGVTSVVAGSPVTYTIVVSNAGPSATTGATFTDTLPVTLTGATWTCTAGAGAVCGAPSGVGNINTTLDLAAGASATYIVTATLSPSATGTLTNTGTVAPGPDATDPAPTNNTGTDTDAITQQNDLAITKTDGVTSVTAGSTVTYTIVVTNNGPSSVAGATVADTLPATLSGATWTCVASGGSCTAAGSGNINDLVNLSPGGTATYTITATLASSATGTLSNTASVTAPGGAAPTDPNPANNSATDSNTIVASADLGITKTDGAASAIAGAGVSYTIVVTNNGPSDVTGAAITDTFPASLTGMSWTCTPSAGSLCGAASGNGNIATTASLPVGGTVTYVAAGTLSATATGTLTNTATVAVPAGTTDPNPANNSATDTDTIVREADLSVTKTDGVTSVVAGTSTTYTIVVSNAGPSSVTGATVTDTFPAALTGATWTCAASAGSACGAASGTGSISTTANLAVGGNATYTVTGTVSPAAAGSLVNTATVAVPAGVTEKLPNNNTATDTNTITAQADVGITRSPFGPALAGATLTYSITVTNAGPSSVNGVTLSDVLVNTAAIVAAVEKRAVEPLLAGATWTCSPTAGSSCSAASGSGDVNITLNLLPGGSATVNVSAPIPANATGTISDTTTVTMPAGVTDPTPGNNTSSVSTAILQQASLSIVKSDGLSSVDAYSVVTYTITVANAGPSNAGGVIVKDILPPELASASWTCVATAGSLCSTASGAGDIDTTVSLAAGGTATFALTATVSVAAGTLSNTATLIPPAGVTDPVTSDNSSTDTAPVLSCPDPPQPLGTVVNDEKTEALLSWSDVGATLYEVSVRINDSAPATLGTTTATQLTVPLVETANTLTWWVIALQGNCYVDGAAATVIIRDPASCGTPLTPAPAVIGTVNSDQEYTFLWLTDDVGVRFEYAESNGHDFTGATWVATQVREARFVHANPGTTPSQFCYAVRAFRDCGLQVLQSGLSEPVCVFVLPAGTPDDNVVIEDGDNELVKQNLRICSDEQQKIFPCPPNPSGQSFAADVIAFDGPTVTLSTDKSWMTVTPSTATVPPTGTTVTVTSNPQGLPTGTNTGSVVATSTTGTASNVPFSVNVVTPVAPSPKTLPPADALIIPAVAHIDGLNSKWQSDIRMTNTSFFKIAYDLTFTPSGENGAQVGKKTRIELRAGETKALDDIVKTWYGLGAVGSGANGVLEIRPLPNSGKGEDPHAVAQFATVASSRTYNNTDRGTYGQWIPAVPFANFIGRATGSSSPILSMQQIAQSSRYRTNLGVVEGAGHPAVVQFTVYTSTGTKLTTFTLPLKPMEHQQLNAVLATKNITLEDGRIEAMVIDGAGQITAYASVVDQQTQDPLLVPGIIATANPATRFVLPGVADLDTGRNRWKSDTRIFNPGPTPITATLQFFEQNAPQNTQSTEMTIGSGEVKVIDDTLRSLYGVTNVGGALHIITPSATPLVVTARTYDQQTTGTFGQFIQAVTANDAIGAADRALEILQIEQSDRYRTNLGIAEVTGNEVTVEITAVVPDSTVAPKLRVTLRPNEFTQLNGVLQQMNLGTVYNARLSIKVVGGSGRVSAYGSVIDQRTQDPTYVPAQ